MNNFETTCIYFSLPDTSVFAYNYEYYKNMTKITWSVYTVQQKADNNKTIQWEHYKCNTIGR